MLIKELQLATLPCFLLQSCFLQISLCLVDRRGKYSEDPETKDAQRRRSRRLDVYCWRNRMTCVDKLVARSIAMLFRGLNFFISMKVPSARNRSWLQFATVVPCISTMERFGRLSTAIVLDFPHPHCKLILLPPDGRSLKRSKSGSARSIPPSGRSGRNCASTPQTWKQSARSSRDEKKQ